MRVGYFTAGTVGAGHLVRGLAVRRALARAGFTGSYRMFGPPQPFTAAVPDDWEAIEIPEALLRSREQAPQTDLARRLARYAPDVLLVDMFWAPLRQVLPVLRCECWLLLRSFPRAWLIGPPDLPFDATQFARIVSIEPGVGDPRVTHAIDPVVIANPDEQRPRGSLRRRLGVPDGARLVAVVHAGARGELAELTPAAEKNDFVAALDLRVDDAIFPAAEWLGDCDRLTCGAGYNAYWEARWLGYAERARFVPFARRNDDQAWRSRLGARHDMKANGADTLARWITG